MKITKQRLKQIIKEVVEDTPAIKYSEYELDDMDTDHQMVFLLKEIVAQLKVMNQYVSPAKTRPTSGIEKALAGATVAEDKSK